MSKQTRLAIAAATSTLLGLSAVAPTIQADGVPNSAAEVRLLLAQTDSKERRDDRQDDRQGDRGDRQDNRDDCRDEGGLAGRTSATASRRAGRTVPTKKNPKATAGPKAEACGAAAGALLPRPSCCSRLRACASRAR
jgi:hypothetical protein